MYKILLPTDFSENSKNAITYALNFYKEMETVFYLLHSYSAPLGGQMGLRDTSRSQSLVKLNNLKEALCTEFDNAKHQFIVRPSPKVLKEEVMKIIIAEGIDAIIMGTQGATGAKAVFLGTRTVRILNIATCPVLVIPYGYTFQMAESLAFVTDFKRNFSADILSPLQSVISSFKSSLRIMHINEEERLTKIQESNRNTLEAYLSKNQPTWHWMPNFSTKTESIQLFLEELEIDFLVMVRYEHGFFEKLLREPVINSVGFCVKVPFLVIPFGE